MGGRLHDDAALLLLRKPAATAGAADAGSPVVLPLTARPEPGAGGTFDDREGVA